jgi:alpha-beta hydrolase superfamily lysophospholipase
MDETDASILDQPEILSVLFYPRPEWPGSPAPAHACDLMIPVADDVAVGARFHPADRSAPNILFFHGNGEIAADYDEIAPFFTGAGVNFLAVDYRGYGRSTGIPTVTAMLGDSHVIFRFTLQWLDESGYPGPILLMGRSLGSASAIELGYHYKESVAGMIIESGFARVSPLLRLFGIDPGRIGFREEMGFRHIEKIAAFDRPTLVIHAERDHLIPFEEGLLLYQACGAKDKTLLKIRGADHNDIFLLGINEYLDGLRGLIKRISSDL